MAEQTELLTEELAESADTTADASLVERCLTFESGGLTLFLSTNYVTEIINDCSITQLLWFPNM